MCRYYLYLYANWLPPSLRTVVTNLDNCDDILLNFLVAHVVHRPPLKLSSRQNDAAAAAADSRHHASAAERLVTRQFCVGHFAEQFGYMPLQRSAVRMEPLLFKDPVSIVRKKYRQMEASGTS
jgi:glucuronyl/N-acetylglucosaminyl transferase EXT1